MNIKTEGSSVKDCDSSSKNIPVCPRLHTHTMFDRKIRPNKSLECTLYANDFISI